VYSALGCHEYPIEAPPVADDISTATSPTDTLLKLRRSGLANSPGDCAEQLAIVADAMAATAQGMSWVAQHADDIDPDMRGCLQKHAEELDGAARMAESWASAIVRVDQ